MNWSIRDEKAQKFMFISVSLEADIDLAMQVIKEESLKHPDLLDLRTPGEIEQGAEPVQIQVLDFNNSMINFRIPLWGKDLPTAMNMTWDIHRDIKLRFDELGIPFGRPSQVNYRGKESLPEPPKTGASIS